MKETILIPTKEWNKVQSMIIDIQEKMTKLLKDKDNELLTPNEICKMLGISRSTYQRYVDDGVIEQLKIKGKAYVKRSEIERLIDEGSL